MVPKAELHVHLEGTAPPHLVRRIAERNGLRVPDGVFATPDRFAWRDFLDFLQTYDMAASVIRTAEDYRDITYEYLAACAAEGAIYVELIASPDHAALVGLTDEEHIEGIAAGIDAARADHNIEARILLTCIRNFGVEQAVRIARYAAGRPHPYVVGFQMAGDEAGYPPGPFAEAYAIAAAAGLGCSVHAGEWAGAESVRAALGLPVTRIGHGVRAIEDLALVDELAEEGIVLEVCPGSNVTLGVYPSFRDHPIAELDRRGVKVTISTDDPPFFHTTMAREYDELHKAFDWDDGQFRKIARQSLDAAFCDADTKARIAKLLEA
jgi:adenosine deaminase